MKWVTNHADSCEGACKHHVGPIQRVHVVGHGHDWGEFWYCQNAIEEDRRRGFTVTIIGPKRHWPITTSKEIQDE